jgi:D-tyrosyl-tRNA(Tyr) deacylase
MRAVIQRVKSASVTVAGDLISSIDDGLLVLLGVVELDGAEDIEWLAQKVATMRIFTDENGGWNLNVQETGGSVLVVSQFTLFASTKKGTKPSWHRAASAETATQVLELFIKALSAHLPGKVESGEFGAMMDVALVNDGPVTLIVDTKARE